MPSVIKLINMRLGYYTIKLSSTSFTVNQCHYFMLLNKRQNRWPWARFSFVLALSGHGAFCFLFEFEESECLCRRWRGWVTLSILPQASSFTIISNPTASSSYNCCLIMKMLESEHLLMVTLEISPCLIKSKDSGKVQVLSHIPWHNLSHTLQGTVQYPAHNRGSLNINSACMQGCRIS